MNTRSPTAIRELVGGCTTCMHIINDIRLNRHVKLPDRLLPASLSHMLQACYYGSQSLFKAKEWDERPKRQVSEPHRANSPGSSMLRTDFRTRTRTPAYYSTFCVYALRNPWRLETCNTLTATYLCKSSLHRPFRKALRLHRHATSIQKVAFEMYSPNFLRFPRLPP